MGCFCPNCGAELASGQKRCPHCGAECLELQMQPKAAARGSLTGADFIEKAKGWESPKKKGRAPGFAMLATLLLLAFGVVAGFLCIHLTGAFAGKGVENAQALPGDGLVQDEGGQEETTIDAATLERALTEEEKAQLEEFIAQFEQKVELILTQDWGSDGIKGAGVLSGTVAEESALWKGLDAQTGAWSGAAHLPRLTRYQIQSYTTQWDGDVLVLQVQERLEGEDPAGQQVVLQFEDTYMLERRQGGYCCFDSHCSELLAALDTYYAEASAGNLEFWIIAGSGRCYTREELERASEFELSVLRNGMYAVSGKIFTLNHQIEDYFSQFKWYLPDTEDDEIVRSRMNSCQIENIIRILEVEREKGYQKS